MSDSVHRASLQPALCLGTLLGKTSGPRVGLLRSVSTNTLARLYKHGFRAVQAAEGISLQPQRAKSSGLLPFASASWNMRNGDNNLEKTATNWASHGYVAGSLLVGGRELSLDDKQRRMERLLEMQQRCGVSLWLETHRGTLTESIPDSLALAHAFPELEWVLDLSHWYVACRLDLIPVEKIVELIQPILRSTRLVHGRIASAAEIQIPVQSELPEYAYFTTVWKSVARYARHDIWFAPELLPPLFGYARTPESSDRWKDALALVDLVCGRNDVPA